MKSNEKCKAAVIAMSLVYQSFAVSTREKRVCEQRKAEQLFV